MTYKESLKHPLWQQKRLLIFERDEFSCQGCHRNDRTLEVHHLFYLHFSVPAWDYPDDWLLTLCNVCHDKEQGREPLEKHFSTTLRTKGFLVTDLLAFSSLIDTNEDFTKKLLKILREFQHG